ncbi:hypothetical protein [Sphingomonas aerophila]|uniref:Uncharacterized protein n=1 Tax=Sphingomonas aerophila TaxID=1344948 RepID=A0A7W9BGP3_9SPHN|nr:hypothetical protein [Sphingomonas aerophila]MBB5716881.1 hypothetical protein [Sphingomonas aerophila]
MTRLSADTHYRIVGRKVETIEDISASMANEIITRNSEILNEWHNPRA